LNNSNKNRIVKMVFLNFIPVNKTTDDIPAPIRGAVRQNVTKYLKPLVKLHCCVRSEPEK